MPPGRLEAITERELRELERRERSYRGDRPPPDIAGRTVIHILSDSDPGGGFAPVEGGLEDVYFATLAPSRRAA